MPTVGPSGVEPICRELQVAPSSYYAAKVRAPSARSVNDVTMKDLIIRIHRANFGVYGIRKVWRTLRRLGTEGGRDQVARLMHEVGLEGATRTKRLRTTKPPVAGRRPADLVERVFAAPAPNRLWVADLTYVWTPRRLLLRRVRDRRVQPGDRRLAGHGEPRDQPRPRRARDGPLRVVRTSQASSIAATGASSTCRSGTPRAWPKRRR
jgi:hypothetical protein